MISLYHTVGEVVGWTHGMFPRKGFLQRIWFPFKQEKASI